MQYLLGLYLSVKSKISTVLIPDLKILFNRNSESNTIVFLLNPIFIRFLIYKTGYSFLEN